MTHATGGFGLLIVAWCATAPLLAQGVVVEVRSTVGEVPIAGAVITLLHSGVSARTDRLGRARLPDAQPGDTLAVAALGFSPDTVAIPAGTRTLVVQLDPVPVALGDVTAAGHGGGAPSGGWIVPRDVIHDLPAAVEPDPFRSLQVVPSVSYSTPFSSRPIVRGYDASMSTVRVDGYEILNPYHIGRIFSAFPGEALESIALTPGPGDVANGNTLAGTVDITGRRASSPAEGGAELVLTSLSAWGGTNRVVPTFGAGRVATVEGASKLFGAILPYTFADGYVRSAIPLGNRRASEVTFFASHDRLGNPFASLDMRWSNLLVGNRVRLAESPRGSLDLTASFNTFRLTGRDIPSRGQNVGLRNRFDRVSLDLQGDRAIGGTLLRFGAGGAWRKTASRLTPTQSPTAPFDQRDRFLEGDAFLEIKGTIGATAFAVGGRADANDAQLVVGPSVSLRRTFGNATHATLRAGRSTRLYQLITDIQAEPDLAFFDLWLTAGRDSVPTPRVDHVSLEVDRDLGRYTLYAAGFYSRGHGLGELRPVSDIRRDDPTGIRFGESRTGGFEFRLGLPPRAPDGASAALSYVLSWSDRKWEDGGWRRWMIDRRHLLRFQAGLPLGKTWRFSGVGEFMSGQPLTPVVAVVDVGGFPTLLFGDEASGRGAGTLRFDLGMRKRFGGPGNSKMEFGFSVINAGFGPVAPSVAEPFLNERNEVQYKRLFSLPAVPSFVLRWEF